MFNLKKLLNDNNLIRDLKTVVSFLLAYAIAVISNGLIEDFSPAALISVAVTLGALGTYFAIKIITNEFTDRGMFDEEESNADLQKRLANQRELSTQIKSTVAYDILTEYNKDKFEYLKKVKYNETKQSLELKVKKYQSMLENAKIMRQLKWFNFINKRYIAKLKRMQKKAQSKLAKLSPDDLLIKYKPVSLLDLKVSNVDDLDTKYNEADRFKITPQKKVRRNMSRTNFVKTFFFVGFQGAAIAQITSWFEFVLFLALMTLTLATTAVSSYVGTRRYASMNYVNILDEKLEKLKWLIAEQQKVDKSQPTT